MNRTPVSILCREDVRIKGEEIRKKLKNTSHWLKCNKW